MITTINEWRKYESLSNDRKNDFKMKLLIQTAKEMIDAYDKSEAFTLAKKTQNEEIKELLNQLGTHSIICKGTLIEVIGEHERTDLQHGEYLKFVESSVNLIGNMYNEMHNKITEAATKISEESSYLRFNKNTKNQETGTLTAESISDMWNTIKGWISSFKNWVSSFISKNNTILENIKAKAQQFKAVTENISTDDAEATINQVDETKIVTALEKAKQLIETAEQEKYFLELAKVKEAQVIQMLNDFKAKSIAIDDKIIAITKMAAKPKLSKAEYMDKMTNAEIVGESVAEMAQNLFSLYTKVSSVSGSVRQYKDDTNSPDGTLDATFDYVYNTVRLKENNEVNEGILDIVTNAWNKIKQFISSFKIASKRVDSALSAI